MDSFKKEFSELLLRYANINRIAKNTTPRVLTPLTKQQISNAIHEVLRNTLNINLQNNDTGALKTPANEIVITTPDAPDVLKVDYNQNNSLHSRIMQQKPVESFNVTCDDLIKLSGPFSPYALSKRCEQKPEVVDNETQSIKLTNTNDKENKNVIIKLDNPAQEEKEPVVNESESFDQKFKKELQKLDEVKNSTLHNIVEDAHQDAMAVVNKLERLRELLMPDSRPIRRLSAMMSLSDHKYQPPHQQPTVASALRTANQRALRRSIHLANEEAQVTPTSSRLSFVPHTPHIQPPSSIKKPTALRPPSKLTANTRSVSTLALPDLHKPAPTMIQKTPLHAKRYAHVQSTIPKPTTSGLVKQQQQRKVQ